ncbi:MAG: hypothetical protein AMXMBFR12_06980 [Candidatus Babeliales bacterium]
MKKNFLVNALSLVLLCLVGNTWTQEKESKELIATPQDERDTQKAIIQLLIASGVGAGAHFFGDHPVFQNTGNFFNLGRGELQAACALTSACAGIALIADKDWKPTFRSAAWRFPLMAMVGGLLNHPYANKGLSFMPLGLGAWFKENPPFGKPGVAAIYSISAWYGLKPSLDRVENAVGTFFFTKKSKNK